MKIIELCTPIIAVTKRGYVGRAHVACYPEESNNHLPVISSVDILFSWDSFKIMCQFSEIIKDMEVTIKGQTKEQLVLEVTIELEGGMLN